jgi:hypothetical protein
LILINVKEPEPKGSKILKILQKNPDLEFLWILKVEKPKTKGSRRTTQH